MTHAALYDKEHPSSLGVGGKNPQGERKLMSNVVQEPKFV